MNEGLDLLWMTFENRRRRQLSDQERLPNSQCVSILEGFEIDMRDDGSHTVSDIHKTVEFESLQDTAQRRSAHLQLFGELALAERAAGFVFEQANPLADRPVDPPKALLGRFRNALARGSVMFLH